MKVELSIADDRELRGAIKDLIKGEIVSIARGEIKTILAEVFKDRMINSGTEDLIKATVREFVSSTLQLGNYSNFIKEQAMVEIKKAVSETFKTLNR